MRTAFGRLLNIFRQGWVVEDRVKRSQAAQAPLRSRRSEFRSFFPCISTDTDGPRKLSFARELGARHFGEWEAERDPLKHIRKEEGAVAEPQVFYPKFFDRTQDTEPVIGPIEAEASMVHGTKRRSIGHGEPVTTPDDWVSRVMKHLGTKM